MSGLSTAALLAMFPDHRPVPGLSLRCACGVAFDRPLVGGNRQAALAIRRHLFTLRAPSVEAERRAARVTRERGGLLSIQDEAIVEDDRRAVLPRCSASQFSFACDISMSAARQWARRRGLRFARGKRVPA